MELKVLLIVYLQSFEAVNDDKLKENHRWDQKSSTIDSCFDFTL